MGNCDWLRSSHKHKNTNTHRESDVTCFLAVEFLRPLMFTRKRETETDDDHFHAKLLPFCYTHTRAAIALNHYKLSSREEPYFYTHTQTIAKSHKPEANAKKINK